MNQYQLKDFDLLKVLKTQNKSISIKIMKVRCKNDNKIYCLRKINNYQFLSIMIFFSFYLF